ncbi:MAG: hypothetical protein US98_C0004G0007 [Parcubacteria group bacterium GW2011_GWC1_38_6]|nr:MAG: hypothetical protein US98_C0004G0007 [Parcubacteria group bacterium GW2011_GWC1_38_6]
MKISPKIYAKVFTQLLQEGIVDRKDLINNFVRVIVKNGDLGKKERILDQVTRCTRELEGKQIAKIESARSFRGALYNNLIKLFDNKHYDIKESVRDDLIAGVRIVINEEKQLDVSFKKILDQVFKNYV